MKAIIQKAVRDSYVSIKFWPITFYQKAFF